MVRRLLLSLFSYLVLSSQLEESVTGGGGGGTAGVLRGQLEQLHPALPGLGGEVGGEGDGVPAVLLDLHLGGGGGWVKLHVELVRLVRLGLGAGPGEGLVPLGHVAPVRGLPRAALLVGVGQSGRAQATGHHGRLYCKEKCQ